MLPANRLRLNQNNEDKGAQARIAALLKSIESFTTDLHKCIADHEKENFVCSGLSIHLILSMCALGAQENTAKEMLQALRLDKDNLSKDFKNVITYFQDSFKQDVWNFFLSDVVDVDFASQREKAVKDINDWCAEKTNNKMKKILSESDIDSLTKMILTNAVYFKACWSNPFCSLNTEIEAFFVDKETTINIPTMHHKSLFMYKDLKRWKAECIAIPYENRRYLFVIIKPKEIDGFDQLQNNLQKIELNYDTRIGKKGDFEYDRIHLALPKFKIESKVDLNKYLPKLGMVEMFTKQADFKGISEVPVLIPPLHVHKILQKAFIEVNEKGTEASALTTIKLRGGGCPPELRDVKVDRPFLYKIVDTACNLTLFSGRVIKPTYD